MQVTEPLVAKYAGALTALTAVAKHAWGGQSKEAGSSRRRGQGQRAAPAGQVLCLSPGPWTAIQAMMQHRSQLTWSVLHPHRTALHPHCAAAARCAAPHCTNQHQHAEYQYAGLHWHRAASHGMMASTLCARCAQDQHAKRSLCTLP